MAEKKKTLVRRNNYLAIPGWVIVDFDLKGCEMNIYSNIYGFSQTENQWFTGSAQYLADWANVTRRQAMSALNSLIEKGLLEKREQYENGVKTVHYRALGYEETSQGMKKFHTPYEKTSHVGMKKLHRGYEKISTDTSIYNIEDILEENKESGVSSRKSKSDSDKLKEIIKEYTDNQDLKSALEDFIRMRIKIKKPLTERALKICLKRLSDLASDDLGKIAHIEQSIEHSWQTFYPLRQQDNQQKGVKPDEWDERYGELI